MGIALQPVRTGSCFLFFKVLFDMGIASRHLQIHPRSSSILLRGGFFAMSIFCETVRLPVGLTFSHPLFNQQTPASFPALPTF